MENNLAGGDVLSISTTRTKKIWKTPEIILLDSNREVNNKHLNNFYEHNFNGASNKFPVSPYNPQTTYGFGVPGGGTIGGHFHKLGSYAS